MSDTRREPSRPLGSPILSWLGAASYVLVAFGVIAAAHFATRPTKPATAANREQHVQLRRDIEAKARQALTQPGRNADGTYRVPLEQTLLLVAQDPRRLDAVRAQALKEQEAAK